MKGWMGRILRVDLNTGVIKTEALDPELAHKYVGGRGLAAKILYDELQVDCDPLGPDNMLIFANGPLTLSGALCSGRYMVVTRSPLTGTICSSNAGGYFPVAFKAAGYDLIIFTGRAEKPCYVNIEDDLVTLRDATDLWGLDTRQTTALLAEKSHRDAKISCIGPAGENLVRYAAIMNDVDRAAARSGVGAVMGSKNLKAVVIHGTKGVTVDNPEEIMRATIMANYIKKTDLGQAFGEIGTPLFVDVMNANNIMPTKNFQYGFFEDGDIINGAEIIDRTLVRGKSCYGCPMNCGRNTRLPEDSRYEGHGDGPEYETCFSLGSNILIGDLDALTKMNYICNEMGMDTIDAGITLGTIMELCDRGLLSEKEIGFPLSWGDADGSIKLLEMIARAEGFGSEAGQGGQYLARKYGAPEVFMGSKGQGFAGYHPRGMVGQGLLYATSPEGGNHTTGNTVQQEINGIPEPMDPLSANGKAKLVIKRQDDTAFVECCGVCVFPYMLMEEGASILAEFYQAVTGISCTEQEARHLGEREFNLERLFNCRLGYNRADDTLPPRLTEDKHTEGIGEGNTVPLEEMLGEYYQLRGWDANGCPSKDKLAVLGLSP